VSISCTSRLMVVKLPGVGIVNPANIQQKNTRFTGDRLQSSKVSGAMNDRIRIDDTQYSGCKRIVSVRGSIMGVQRYVFHIIPLSFIIPSYFLPICRIDKITRESETCYTDFCGTATQGRFSSELTCINVGN